MWRSKEETMRKIFIIEDEQDIIQAVHDELKKWGYDVTGVSDWDNMMAEVKEADPVLILMDITLPMYDGFYWTQQIRSFSQVPIIFISAADFDQNAVRALMIGADDYLVKPFAMDLLTAKVQAVLRRVNAVQEKSLEKFGCELNLLTNDLDFQGESVRLTPTEGLIMKLLMLNANQTVSKKKLISALWQGNNFIDENVLNVNLSRLRGKLSTLEGPLQITTVRGQGYRLEEKL